MKAKLHSYLPKTDQQKILQFIGVGVAFNNFGHILLAI